MDRIGIIGAMELEVDILIDMLNVIEKRVVAGNAYYRGMLGAKEVIITCCGVGKINAASSTQILISEFKVDAIINTGIAGGLHSDIEVGHIVISKNVAHHDVSRTTKITCYPYREFFIADERLIEIALSVAKKDEVIKRIHHLGRIVSGERFINDDVTRNKIIDRFQPHCVEMEGSAIGHVAHINDVPFIVIRSISDKADSDALNSIEEFEDKAAKQSARFVWSMIEMI